MRYRMIGLSGIKCSVVGLGTWGTGGWMWGGADENESIDAIHAAIDMGINLIDTAPIYGFGKSEEIVGRAIADRREKVLLITKCGQVWHTDKGTHAFDDGDRQVYHYLGPESIEYELEQSLQRLRTDYIDIYMVHVPDSTTPVEETMSKLIALKEEGKIRAIGVSNMTYSQLIEYHRAGPLDCDEEKYSMLDRSIEAQQIPYCRNHDVALIAYSPLSQGLLTGKISPATSFTGDDMRRKNFRFEPENLAIIRDMLSEIEPIAADHRLTLSQLAIAWTISHPGVTHVLAGARRSDQARENAIAGDAFLSDETLSELQTIIDQYASQIQPHAVHV